MIRNSMCEGTWKEVHGDEKNIKLLNETLGDIELTTEEERSLIWLSTWETSTVKQIISAFKKGLKK